MCSGCGKSYPTVNKKYDLCNDCNYKRLNGGRSRTEVYAERSAAKPVKVYTIKTKSKPKQQTDKERIIKNQLSELKRDIELEAVQNNEYFCKGCAESYSGLDKSHILSVGQYKHLELVRRNIQLLCRNCHTIWEKRNTCELIKLDCYWDNLIIIYDLDQQAFQKELTKLDEYIRWQLDQQKSALSAKRINLLEILGLVNDLKMD